MRFQGFYETISGYTALYNEMTAHIVGYETFEADLLWTYTVIKVS